ncbi:DUF4097 family beta strand repeat-containing protein [Psychrosphaera sp.]|nr:DUF4097 family beta strand repeat-containing protein [Psychrosphaera sp.]
MNLTKSLIKFSLLSVVALSSATLWAGEKIDKTLTAQADGRVNIDVMTGLVTVKSWDKNEVKVIGELDDQAKGYQFESLGNRILFRVEMPEQRWGNWKDSSAALTFYIPKQSDLRFEGVNVSIDVEGITGSSRINTVNGDITALGLNKRINLETVNGKIKSVDLNGDITLSTVNGEVDDKNSQGEMEVSTVNGDINIESTVQELAIENVNGDMNLLLRDVIETEINTVNGDIKLDYNHNKKGKVYISTVGGEVDLYVPDSISGVFQIETHTGGDIVNKLTDKQSKRNRYGPGESLEFETAGGLIKFDMNTVNGDITILKKN